jgi:hypothetical protein
MSGRLLSLLRRGFAAGVLLLVPLPAALALAPAGLDASEAPATVDGMQVLELLGEGREDWDTPDPGWPFGIPRWSEEPTAWEQDEPAQLAGNAGPSHRG